ncbi:MAG: AAA family ATPase [Gammaproteobacteria bacterium]|jgi:general secretion pathway protein A
MYNTYFGFKESPFSIAPDPRYLFMTEQHREALAHLVYGLNSEGGCILLTGEVGTGKTTVCRCLLEQIPERSNIALVFNPKVTATELLETICDELGIDYPQGENSVKTYIDRINAFLLQANAAGQKTVLIIDEAQNMDHTVLEQLRLLTNLETNQRKLLQIIILGQPELLEILSHENMRQLAQRITARFHLKPLSRFELKAYISHRLAVAGSNIQLFDEKAQKKLYQLSKGIPRIINIICDRALLGAYVENKARVDLPTLNNAAREVFGEQQQNKRRSSRWPAVITVVAGIAAVAAVTFALIQPNTLKSSVTHVRSQAEPQGASSTASIVAMKQESTATEALIPASEEETSIPPVEKEMFIPAAEKEMFIPAGEEESVARDTIRTEIAEETAIALTNSGASTAAQTASAFYDLVFSDTSTSKIQAYTDLLDVWNREYDPSTDGTACSFAKLDGLSCLHRQGNLRSLAILNRPAVLKLYDEKHNAAYAVLTHLNDDEAALRRGDKTINVSTGVLNRYWLGEYTLLWQKPPYYRAAIQPGNQGPLVQWLDQQLVRIYGQDHVPTIHDTYNEELRSQIIKFQQSKGLIPDGVVGPHTFILLNSELDVNTPMLNTRKG